MKFKLPDTLDGLSLEELNALLKDAQTEYGDLAAIEEADLTDEQLDDLESLANAVDTIVAATGAVEAAAAARSERIAAAKSKIESTTVGENPEGENPEDTDPEGDPAAAEDAELEVVIPDDASELTQEEAVVASAAVKRPVARRAASKAPATKADPIASLPVAKLKAAADVRGFGLGQELAGMGEAAKAFISRVGGFSNGTPIGQRYGAFTIEKAVDERFALSGGRDLDGDVEKIMRASKEQRDGGALVAAGGWCAPSETVYNLPELETISGILNLPEVTINRGGINFTKGPDFASIYANTGFLQTETQAEAGTQKPLLEVECPDFEEKRLDAIGWGMKAPLLTRVGYPELIQRFLNGATVAHAHKLNASKINRVVAYLGVAINANEFGSAVGDSLTALEIQALRLRYRYRLDIDAPLEGFAPAWFLSVLRADLAYQEGVENKAVTSAQVNAWLAARGISLQWVMDWQDLGATGTGFPSTVQVALYPAGAYVAGTTPVISVDAVYDTDGLTHNEYLAAFFEEGLLVFNPVASGVLVEVALEYRGRSGAKDITSKVWPDATDAV